MRKLLLLLLGFTLPLSAFAVQVAVPSASTDYQALISSSTGQWLATSSPTFRTICFMADNCRTTWPTFSMSFAFPFTKQAGGEQATTTTLGLFNGFLSLASSTNLALFTTSNLLSLGSSTLQNFTATNSTSTNATTSSFAISNITSKLLKTDGNGSVLGATSGVDYQAAGSYALQATTITVAGTVNQITSSAAGQDLSTNRTWTLSFPTTLRFAQASSTVLDSGFASFGRTSTTTINGTGDLFVVSSTTLQNFTATNSTTSQATTTNFASGTICLSNDCRTAWPTSSMTFAWPWTKQADLGQATSTLIEDWGGLMSASTTVTALTITGKATSTSDFLHLGSTTLQDFTAKTSTTTSATTTNLAVSGLSSNGFVKTYGGTGNFTIDTNTYLTSAVTAVTATYPILATTGNTPALSFAFGTTTANSWSLLNQFNLASTSVFSAGFASFGRTSTTTINGTGDLFVVSSTTLQNFTATNATTSQATTTNFAVTQSATLSKIPYISPSGNIQALGIGTNLTLTNGTLSASGGSAGIATTTFATTTSTVTGNALAYLLNDTDILSIGAKATTTAKFWVDPNVLNPTYVFQIGSTTAGSAVGASVLYGVTPNGHFSATSTRPGISGCGSGATITGTDAFGMVTPGTSQPGICLVTFNKAYANAPVCQVTGAGYSGGGKIWLTFNATTSSTLLTITSVATATGATTLNVPFPSYRVAYDCKEVLP